MESLWLSVIFFGGVEAREEDAEGNEASAEFPEACSDRSQRTADAEALRGMGDDSPGFCGQDVTERGTDGVFARRQLSDNGVRGANWGTERFSRYSKKRGVSKKKEKRRDG